MKFKSIKEFFDYYHNCPFCQEPFIKKLVLDKYNLNHDITSEIYDNNIFARGELVGVGRLFEINTETGRLTSSLDVKLVTNIFQIKKPVIVKYCNDNCFLHNKIKLKLETAPLHFDLKNQRIFSPVILNRIVSEVNFDGTEAEYSTNFLKSSGTGLKIFQIASSNTPRNFQIEYGWDHNLITRHFNSILKESLPQFTIENHINKESLINQAKIMLTFK